jgi:hypothetical protein
VYIITTFPMQEHEKSDTGNDKPQKLPRIPCLTHLMYGEAQYNAGEDAIVAC